MAELIGLGVLACLLATVRLTAGPLGMPHLTWLLIYLGLATVAEYLWHSERWPKSFKECLTVSGVSILVGAVFFAIDVFVGGVHHPELPWLKAGTQAGGPFGFYLTLLVCPGLTMVALAGAFRARVQKAAGR